MTDSNWTSDEIARDFKDCTTVGEVIRRLETMAASRGEVICEIRVNGRLLDENEEADLTGASEMKNPRAGLQSLSIRCDRPQHLILQALRSTLAFIPLLVRASLDTSRRFREGDISNGSIQLSEALEGCQWFVETIHHARGAASGIGEGIDSIERWHAAEQMLSQVIAELTTTFDRKDFTVVSDILEYDLTAALEMWAPVLTHEADRRPI